MSVVDGYEKPQRTVRLARAPQRELIDDLTRRIALSKIGVDTSDLSDSTPQWEQELAEAKQAAEDDAIIFVFEAISPKRLEELIVAYPSSNEEERFDPTAFPPALLAESCVQAGDDDGLPIDEAIRLWDTFSEGDATELFGAAWEVSRAANLLPFSVTGTDKPGLRSVPNSTTAPPAASPTAGS